MMFLSAGDGHGGRCAQAEGAIEDRAKGGGEETCRGQEKASGQEAGIEEVRRKKICCQRAKSAAKSIAAKTIPARKSVPIKKARVSKRALLPPLPPPASARKTARSPARVPSRAKTLGRAKTGSSRAVHEIPACTEVVLRQKLRLAAPYIELWLVQRDGTWVEEGTTPEAAFVRVWQWLMLEAALEGSHVVITPDLVQKLFAEEMGRAPTA
jgi:hypothetical protein